MYPLGTGKRAFKETSVSSNFAFYINSAIFKTFTFALTNVYVIHLKLIKSSVEFSKKPPHHVPANFTQFHLFLIFGGYAKAINSKNKTYC